MRRNIKVIFEGSGQSLLGLEAISFCQIEYRLVTFLQLLRDSFISLDCLAEELEDPFGTENNDLPLDAICNAIEIDLLQMNDEAEIPAKILPDRHYQLT